MHSFSNAAESLVKQSDLGNRIRVLRLRNGWDQGELARRAELARGTIINLEKGETLSPQTKTVIRLAHVLGVSVEEFCDLQPSRPSSGFNHSQPFQITDEQCSHDFDRATNHLVDEVREEQPHLFTGWTRNEWDELYSNFGTGGALTREGVAESAEAMNRTRKTIQQLRVVLETHLADLASGYVEVLYRSIRPESNLSPSTELAALLAEHQKEDENSKSTSRQ